MCASLAPNLIKYLTILLLGTRLELVCKSQRDSNFWIIISVHINARIRHIEVSPFHLQLLDLLGVYSNDHIINVPCPQLFTSRGASLQSTCTSPGKVDEHDITYIMLTMHVSTLEHSLGRRMGKGKGSRNSNVIPLFAPFSEFCLKSVP